jgi:hypothetical protein
MPETAQRRLVKSPPEIWTEISDAHSLARRLSALGEVRITRIEPETAVAWEGASIRGTVELEASGWGTKVTITAEREQPELEQAAHAAQDTQPFDSSAIALLSQQSTTEATGTDIPPRSPGPMPREDGVLARLKGWWRSGRRAAREPDAEPEPAPAELPAERAGVPEVEPVVHERAVAPAPARDPELEGMLVEILDDLGAAHHRPFSRA